MNINSCLFANQRKERGIKYHCKPTCFSVTQLGPILCNTMDCRTPDLFVLHHLPKFPQVHVHWISDAIQPSHPLMPSSIFPSISDFSNELAVPIRWPKYWVVHQWFIRSFRFIHPSNEYSGLISLKIDWLDLIAIQTSQVAQW